MKRTHPSKRDCPLVSSAQFRTLIVLWVPPFRIALVGDTEKKDCLPILFMCESLGLPVSLSALSSPRASLSNLRVTQTTMSAKVSLAVASSFIHQYNPSLKLRRIL